MNVGVPICRRECVVFESIFSRRFPDSIFDCYCGMAVSICDRRFVLRGMILIMVIEVRTENFCLKCSWKVLNIQETFRKICEISILKRKILLFKFFSDILYVRLFLTF